MRFSSNDRGKNAILVRQLLKHMQFSLEDPECVIIIRILKKENELDFFQMISRKYAKSAKDSTYTPKICRQVKMFFRLVANGYRDSAPIVVSFQVEENILSFSILFTYLVIYDC